MIVEIIMYRHGQTDLNKHGKMQSKSDLSLNETGKKQAQEIANQLPKDLKLCFCSSMVRAVETAQIALDGNKDVALCVDDGFKEVSFGEAESITTKSAREKYKAYFDNVFDIKSSMNMHIKLPGGESHAEAILRFKQALNKCLNEYEDVKKVVIFSHGALIGALAKEGLGVGRIKIGNGKKVEFYYNKKTNKITNFKFDGITR